MTETEQLTETEQSTGAGSTALALVDVHKSFGGVQALVGATVECHRGEVHGVIGENGAGKSTLIKILAGAVHADSGQIVLAGRQLQLRSPKDAREAGIRTVFQELSLIRHLSVAQNLFYGAEPDVRLGRIGVRSLRAEARKVLAQYGFSRISPDSVVSQLPLADRQVLEIVKALIAKPEVLVLDEPTSALFPDQVEWLFGIVKEFARQGGIVVFISHRMAEVEQLCDRVTVLRNGEDVGHGPMSDMPEDRLVELMLGRRIERFYARSEQAGRVRDEVVLELEAFGAPPGLHDIGFKLHRGETIGVGGLAGQGQAELFLALFGARRSHGKATVNGKRARLASPSHALASGIALVPEDRASEGLCLSLSIKDNIALGNLRSISAGPVIIPPRERTLVRSSIDSLRIKLRSPRQEANSLSGGNQQKLLLSRVLASHPSLLLLFDATRGVDVGTKTDIYELMQEQCRQGVGILFYSTDAWELANMADEVLVLHDGTIRVRLSGDELTAEQIVAAAVGGGKQETAL